MGGGTGVAVELSAVDYPPDEECLLQAPQSTERSLGATHETLEEIVEGADRAAEQRPTAHQQLSLDPVDVRPVRHDEHRLEPVSGIECVEITVEQELDFARVGRARDEAERHPPTLALHPAGEELRSSPEEKELRAQTTGAPKAGG